MISRIAAQLRDPLILILLAAAVVTIPLGDIPDTIVILLVITLNTSVGVVQEAKADRAVSALRQLSAPQARVVRSGQPRIVPAAELVPNRSEQRPWPHRQPCRDGPAPHAAAVLVGGLPAPATRRSRPPWRQMAISRCCARTSSARNWPGCPHGSRPEPPSAKGSTGMDAQVPAEPRHRAGITWPIVDDQGVSGVSEQRIQGQQNARDDPAESGQLVVGCARHLAAVIAGHDAHFEAVPAPLGHMCGEVGLIEQPLDGVATGDVVDEESSDAVGHLCGMPPVRPATTGVPSHNASETTRPKPSRIDFWTTTSERVCSALTSMLPTPVRLVKTWIIGSALISAWMRS